MPSPEQTASPLSYITYSYVDGLIWKALRVPHLPFEMLPALADFNKAEYLRSISFHLLDPPHVAGKERRHIFWGLLHAYRQWRSTLQRLFLMCPYRPGLCWHDVGSLHHDHLSVRNSNRRESTLALCTDQRRGCIHPTMVSPAS